MCVCPDETQIDAASTLHLALQHQLPEQGELFRRQQAQGLPAHAQRSDYGPPYKQQSYGYDPGPVPRASGATSGYYAPRTPNGVQHTAPAAGYTSDHLRNQFCHSAPSYARSHPATKRAPPPLYQGGQRPSNSNNLPGGGLFLPPQQTDHRCVNVPYKSPLAAAHQHGSRPRQQQYSYSGPAAGPHQNSASSYASDQRAPPPPTAPSHETLPESEPQPSTSKTVAGALSVGGILLPAPVAAKKPRVSLDLTADEADLTNAPPKRSRAFDPSDDLEMPSSFTPRDPTQEGYPSKKSGLLGINPFGDDGFYADPKPGQSTSGRPTRGGRSGTDQQRYAFQSRQSQKAPSKRKAGKDRVVGQFAEPLPREVAGRCALERQQAQAQTAKNGRSEALKGAKEITLDSDDDEESHAPAVHPHEDEDDRIESDDYGSSSHRPIASTSKHAQRGAARFSAPHGADEPSSPDPIGMGSQRDEVHRNKKSVSKLGAASFAADTVVHGHVRGLAASYESKVQPRTVVGSLRKKGERAATTTVTRNDGGPTDDGEFNFSAVSGRPPRASLAMKGIAAANPIRTVKCKGMILGEECLVSNPEKDCAIVVTMIGPKPKLTLRLDGAGSFSDEGLEIHATDVYTVEYNLQSDDSRMPYVCIGFGAQGGTAFDAINRASFEDYGTSSKTLLVYLKKPPMPGWQSQPISDEDHLMSTLAHFTKQKFVKDSDKKAAKRSGYLDICVSRIRTEPDQPHSSKKGKKKAKQPDPKQPRLNFGPQSPHQSDSRQALTKLARNRSESQEYEGSRTNPVPQANGTRRSSRPSTSSLAGPNRTPMEAMQVETAVPVLTKEEQEYEHWLKRGDAKYKPDEVVAEFPPGQPGAITLPWSDMKRLRPDEFLNDTLIEFGLKQIMQRIEAADADRPPDDKIAPKVHIFNSFFYKQLSTTKKKGTDPYKLVEKWTKKVDLFTKRYIVVPINEHFHWYLAMIINPHALLRPPPPPVEPEPPRQSARTKRPPASTAVEESQGIVSSPHFRLPKVLREERKKGLRDVPRDMDNVVSASDGEETPDADADEADDSAETARRITEQLQANGDDEAASQNLRELTLDESRQLGGRDAGYSQVRNDVMQVDGADERVAGESVPEEGDDEEMIFEDARGTLEGGGSRKIDQSPSPSRQHKRWDSDTAPAPSVPVAQGSPEVEIVAGKLAPSPQRTSSPTPSAPLASQEQARQLAADLFPSTAGSPTAAENGKQAEPTVVLSSGTFKGDEDDDIEVITSATKADPARAHLGGGQDQSESSKTGSTAVGRGQMFAPTDPEPDREEQIRRDREEAERLERQEAEQQAEAAKQRRLKRLEEAKAETDIDGCWILTFDSLGGPHKAVTNRLKQYLVSEAVSKLGKQPEELSIEQVQAGRADVPQQPNYCDCGLYLLHFVEHFLRNPDYMLNVVAATQTAAARAGKRAQKDVQDAEEDRNLNWAFEEAQKRRARMRGEVKGLVDHYAEGADERRQREEAIKEERRKRRQAEKEREEELQTRLAVERAEQYEAESARDAASMAPTEEQAPAQLVFDGETAPPTVRMSQTVAGLASPEQGPSPTEESGATITERSNYPGHDAVESTEQPRAESAIESGAGSAEPLQLNVKGSASASISSLSIKGAARSLRSPEADFGDLERGNLVGGNAAAPAVPADDVNPSTIGTDLPVEEAGSKALRALGDYASNEPSPSPSETASSPETGRLESDDEEAYEPSRRRAPRGRGASPPLRQSASTLIAALEGDDSPELRQPPANQEQQQRDTPRAGQKRTTRSSVAGESPAALSHDAVADELRPAKRLRGVASASSSTNASRAPSPAVEEEQARPASARAGKARAKRGGAGKGRRGRKDPAPVAPPETLVIDSTDDDDERLD